MNKSHAWIMSHLIYNSWGTIPAIAAEMGVSIGTATKLVGELCEKGLIRDGGTIDTTNGRKPHRFELNPDAGFFLGIDIAERFLSFGLMDFAGKMVEARCDAPFALSDTLQSLESFLFESEKALQAWSAFKPRIRAVGVSIPGRTNIHTGRSYTVFTFLKEPLADVISQRLGLPVFLNNDSRAMAYAEYLRGCVRGEKNVIYINVNWGLGAGIIIDGRLFSGRSGYAGEFGHMHGFNNEILCRCGKKGCLETEISGQALRRKLVSRIQAGESSILSERVLSSDEPLTLDEILDAVRREDVLCIDVIEDIGTKLGVRIAGLVNLFNPELVVIGGEVSKAGEYLIHPMRTALNKFCLNVVYQDTDIRLSTLGADGPVLGACLLARPQVFNQL